MASLLAKDCFAKIFKAMGLPWQRQVTQDTRVSLDLPLQLQLLLSLDLPYVCSLDDLF